MKTTFSVGFVLALLLLIALSGPVQSFNFQGNWVGTVKRFAANNTEIAVYSSEYRRELLFVLPPHVPVTSPDGTHHYKLSDIKVGTYVRVHVDMPYGFSYYGYGASIGSLYVTHIDIVTGQAIHANIQKSLQETLPSPSPRAAPTSPAPVPIIFVSPTPTPR
jgi:hypothetical protein